MICRLRRGSWRTRCGDCCACWGSRSSRYAARKYLDHGSVSRFLSGERIPPWNFVHDLLVEATEHRDGVPPTQPVVEHLMRLRRSALEAGGSPSHQVQLLQDRLHDADREASRAAARERELREALQAAQHRAAELLVSEREARGLSSTSNATGTIPSWLCMSMT